MSFFEQRTEEAKGKKRTARDFLSRSVLTKGYCTNCTTEAELDVKLGVALYVAVILFDPGGSELVLKVATPPDRVTVASSVPPRLNFTVPVGTAVPELTVAVKVTLCPLFDGFTLELSAVVVLALAITCVTDPEAGLCAASPLYEAVTTRFPASSDEVERLAPPPLIVPVPSTVAPVLKETDWPSSVGPEVVSVAVKVTVWP
jgi:hypothetical protein